MLLYNEYKVTAERRLMRLHDASKEEINSFLKKYRRIMFQPNKFHLVPRTFDGFTNLGLTVEQVKHEIKTLKYLNYDRGPTPDENKDGTDIWEFGKLIDGKLVYIKLKLDPLIGCKCLSFKESNGPFTLPYKNWD